MVIETLYDLTSGDAIITTGVGQHQMWAGQWYKYRMPAPVHHQRRPRLDGLRLSRRARGQGGARPDKQVIDIDGDGSFLMNIQELATAHVEKIAAKAIILNNQHLGMVVQWEDNFYAGNRGHTYLGDPEHRAQVYPGLRACLQQLQRARPSRSSTASDLTAALQRMLDCEDGLRA
jgi:acetolactate synthase-1/2/3 large subunit